MTKKHDIIWLDTTDSTNEEARRNILSLDNLSVVSAYSQTAGRGQRGNTWSSSPRENLTFSIVIKYGHEYGHIMPMRACDQSAVSEAAALAVVVGGGHGAVALRPGVKPHLDTAAVGKRISGTVRSVPPEAADAAHLAGNGVQRGSGQPGDICHMVDAASAAVGDHHDESSGVAQGIELGGEQPAAAVERTALQGGDGEAILPVRGGQIGILTQQGSTFGGVGGAGDVNQIEAHVGFGDGFAGERGFLHLEGSVLHQAAVGRYGVAGFQLKRSAVEKLLTFGKNEMTFTLQTAAYNGGAVPTYVVLDAAAADYVVNCETVAAKIDGSKLSFKICAYDEAGLIGEGVPERFIVASQRFLDKTYSKL